MASLAERANVLAERATTRGRGAGSLQRKIERKRAFHASNAPFHDEGRERPFPHGADHCVVQDGPALGDFYGLYLAVHAYDQIDHHFAAQAELPGRGRILRFQAEHGRLSDGAAGQNDHLIVGADRRLRCRRTRRRDSDESREDNPKKLSKRAAHGSCLSSVGAVSNMGRAGRTA